MEEDIDERRKLRVKERRHYTEDCLQDDEIEGRRMFTVEDKVTSPAFTCTFVKEMKGEDFSLKYFQENGFEYPMLFKSKANMGMRLPSHNFTCNDVRQCVGSRRILDVMDVTTQKDIEMTMKDWCRYFENPNRDKLLNVISLEFSHTKLENYVESPSVVRQVDWVDVVWPRHLKELQTEGTNAIEDMRYPKVQKYCLMSVKGCYTDFHIDFGGTSVWYHLLRGQKVFWLIPPTKRNFQLYEQWVLSGKQGDVFFGETVEKCDRVTLNEGDTFFIPTAGAPPVEDGGIDMPQKGRAGEGICLQLSPPQGLELDPEHFPKSAREAKFRSVGPALNQQAEDGLAFLERPLLLLPAPPAPLSAVQNGRCSNSTSPPTPQPTDLSDDL
ncbi:hypothetical protein HPB47_008514 [Ixodes persulcatus]|uniref:Uncharacterized protein n=1 Tax=Ixodes persulcatus TaxID=34615 RepID=A0AC60P4T8_IXOPE|nr:hypothetical protein HPB47_008514 [Ixodes persulcatus]